MIFSEWVRKLYLFRLLYARTPQEAFEFMRDKLIAVARDVWDSATDSERARCARIAAEYGAGGRYEAHITCGRDTAREIVRRITRGE